MSAQETISKSRDIKAPKKEKDEIEALKAKVAELESKILALKSTLLEAKAKIAEKARKVRVELNSMMYRYGIDYVYYKGIRIKRTAYADGAEVQIDNDGYITPVSDVWILENQEILREAIINEVKERLNEKIKDLEKKLENYQKILKLADMKI